MGQGAYYVTSLTNEQFRSLRDNRKQYLIDEIEKGCIFVVIPDGYSLHHPKKHGDRLQFTLKKDGEKDTYGMVPYKPSVNVVTIEERDDCRCNVM